MYISSSKAEGLSSYKMVLYDFYFEPEELFELKQFFAQILFHRSQSQALENSRT